MASILPQELIDCIIDQVVPDKPSLLACSIVCHSFRSRCRAHLFSTVLLSSTVECQRFYSLLGRDADVAPLVRRLDILDPIPHDPRHYNDDTWIAKDTFLPYVIQRVAPSLKFFALTSEGYHFGDSDFTHVFRWDRASDDLKRSIGAIFASTNMIRVELAGLLIDSCHTLFSLLDGSSLTSFSLPAFWHDKPCETIQLSELKVSERRPRHLQSLSISLTPCLATYMLRPSFIIDVANLTELSIKVPSNCSFDIRSAATEILTPYLKKLTLEECIYFGEIPQVFSLAHCTNLAVIHLVTRIYEMNNAYWTYISRMMETIAPHPHNSVREIQMELDLVSTIDPGDVSEWLDWTALEQVLALPTMAKLERVNVMLNIRGHSTSDNVEVWIGKGLPVLQRKGVRVGMRHRYN